MAKPQIYDITRIRGRGIVRDINSSDYLRHRLDTRMLTCDNCQSIMFREEKVEGTVDNPIFSLCCSKKKFNLPPSPPMPIILLNLLNSVDARSEMFLSKTRLYNSAFAFTSLNAKVS